MNADWRADIARAIADGDAVDWPVLEAGPAAAPDLELLEELRVLEHVARVHTEPGSPSLFDRLPAVWGPLTVLAQVGRGTFGDVYRAHDTRLDRPVALKILRRQDPAGASALAEEARLLARVDHPNVVTVYGAERIDGQVGVWMSFIDGPTLEDELRENGPFEPSTVGRIAVDLCDALAAVHSAGVVHQDVKAQNVMRAPDGRVVLMDFGAGSDKSGLAQDSAANLAGTPLYLAPEILAHGAASRQSDIYSLGVLLFHLLTGSFPVLGRTIDDLRRAHVDGHRTPCRAVRPDAPAPLARVIDRCLASSPTNRFQDAAAAAGAFRAAVARTWSAPRIAAIAGLVLIVLASAFGLWWRAGDQPLAIDRPASRLITKLPEVAGMFSRISQDGRFVSYVDWSTGNLMLRDLTTSRDRQLTDKGTWAQSGQSAEQSAISRDGRRIAFAWFEPALRRFVLRVASLDGTGVPASSVLLDQENLSWVAPFDWSPDNDHIVVWRNFRNGGGDLALVSVRDLSTKIFKRLDQSGPSSVCFSPDGRYLAFDQAAGDDQRIVLVASTDPWSETPVVAAAATNSVVGWSPDGGRLLVASDRGQSLGLWAIPIGDGAPHGPPVLLRPSIDPESIGLSSSGTLFSVSGGIGTNVEVAGVDLERGTLIDEPRRRIEQSVGFNAQPAWSPDGQYLTFVSSRHEVGVTRVLAVQSARTGKIHELLPKLGLLLHPSWAPDGRSIVVGGKDLTGRPGAFEIDVRSGSVTVLVLKKTDGSFIVQPRWSPDGRRLYYRLADHDPRGNAVVQWDRRTGREQVLTRRREYIDALEVSPDGRLIAVALETGVVILVPADGGETRELFRAHRNTADRRDSVAWTRDGTLLVSAQETADAGKRRLWHVPIGGGQPRAMVGTIGQGIALHPNGREIAFTTRSEAPREIWVLEHFLPEDRRTR